MDAPHPQPARRRISLDAASYIRKQFATIYRVEDGITGDLTDEELNWAPPGTANTIAATLIHAISSEDGFIQRILQGKEDVWTAGQWEDKIGLKTRPGKGQGWEEVKNGHFSVAAILAYSEAVRSATYGYLETLTPDELDRPVNFYGNQWTVADVLALLAEHTAHHAGEIAALKGAQGAKGMPI